MTPLTIYRANDGTQHKTAAACIAHEATVERIAAVMAPLELSLQSKSRVQSGEGWVQHSLDTVHQCREGILQICRDAGYAKSYPAFNAHGREAHPLSIIGRILNDNGGPLDVAWSRFARIDEQGREHQQPYFAYTNGPDVRHYCIEDRRAKA